MSVVQICMLGLLAGDFVRHTKWLVMWRTVAGVHVVVVYTYCLGLGVVGTRSYLSHTYVKNNMSIVSLLYGKP